ncbi:MAG: SusD/RagB family nutrient-binding outer membrane lipoprotein [Candidatus Cryptobacteroides sp.]
MKKYISIFLLAAVLGLTGCREWLDINTNPNYVSEADAALLMPSAQLQTADKVGYELALIGHFWSQYVVQNKTSNQYLTVMNYDLTFSSSYFSHPWSYEYSRILPALKTILDETDGVEGKSNYALEAKTLLAYNLYLLTSLYDKVAYKEGPLSDEFFASPHFETGEEMQEILLGILDEIRNMDPDLAETDEAANPSTGSDMIFAGDTEGWFQFANTLYLKLLMRDFSKNKSKIEALLAEDDFLASDAKFDHFLDATNKSNPLYESDRRQLNTTNNILCCSDILNVLSSSDPRLENYYEGGAAGSIYGQTGDPAVCNKLKLDATDPVCFSTVEEVYFLKAEAYARLNNSAKAKENYENAISASFERWGCSGADAFLAGDYAFSAGTSEAMVEQIINHKWASNVRCMPIESWFDRNRTGYPSASTITDFSGSLDSRAVRFYFPEGSQLYNENAPEVEELTAKMWWHK